MTFSLGRLRFGRSSGASTSSSAPSSPATPVVDDITSPGDALRANSTQRAPTPTTPSPRARFGSWLARVRTRKDSTTSTSSASAVSGGRPATPTPHLLLASASGSGARDARMKTLRRVRAQATPGQPKEVLTAHDDDEEEEEGVTVDEDEDEDEEVEVERRGEDDMSEAERARLASFASGLRGLIAQLQLADEESRSIPPMKNAEGTPLSPITEAEELDNDDEFAFEFQQHSSSSALASEPSTCSVDAVTDLDYGEPEPLEVLEALVDSSESVDLDVTPRWCPALDEEDEEEGVTPVFGLGDAKCFGRVRDEVVERELGLCGDDDEEAETEDEQEYFSAASLPVSSGEEEGEGDTTFRPELDFGLHLRGLGLARSVSTIEVDVDSESTSTTEEADVNDVVVEPATPRAFEGVHLPSQPALSPVTVNIPAKPMPMRQRAATLPSASGSGKERAIPPLPPLVIPTAANVMEGVEEKDVGQLVHAVARLQREKARLEQALVCANLKIGQQDSQLASLTKQIAALRATLMRLACAGPGPDPEVDESDSDVSSGEERYTSIPIIVRAPSSLEEEEEEIRAGISTESVNPLSTPPATPDRRAASALVAGAEGDENDQGEKTKTKADVSLSGALKVEGGSGIGRGLVRRKSAGAASALSALGVGRAQVKRRAGSADLKTLTTAMPWS